MAAAIHTKYVASHRSSIRAFTKEGGGGQWFRMPYPHDLPHDFKHPAAAKGLAERLGWKGLWVVGHNADGSICAVLVAGSGRPGSVIALESRFGREGADWFRVE